LIRTVCLNPALDKTVQVPSFTVDAVNRITKLRRDAGGKGINVSKVIRELGGASVAYALLAGSTGHAIEQAVRASGIELVVQWVDGETRTNLKIVDPVLYTNTDVNEPGPKITKDDLEGLLALLVGDVSGGDIVVLSGSLPRGAAPDTYGTWTRACAEAGARVFLDADGDALVAGISAGPDLIKPNDHELSELVGRELTTTGELASAARELMGQDVGQVVVSRGSEGALFVSPGDTICASSPKVVVGSTVGAGDSMMAAIAFAATEGLDAHETARLASATGAANVMQSGTQAAPRTLVDCLLDQVTLQQL
jgi:1-phosphofructokinase